MRLPNLTHYQALHYIFLVFMVVLTVAHTNLLSPSNIFTNLFCRYFPIHSFCRWFFFCVCALFVHFHFIFIRISFLWDWILYHLRITYIYRISVAARPSTRRVCIEVSARGGSWCHNFVFGIETKKGSEKKTKPKIEMYTVSSRKKSILYFYDRIRKAVNLQRQFPLWRSTRSLIKSTTCCCCCCLWTQHTTMPPSITFVQRVVWNRTCGERRMSAKEIRLENEFDLNYVWSIYHAKCDRRTDESRNEME